MRAIVSDTRRCSKAFWWRDEKQCTSLAPQPESELARGPSGRFTFSDFLVRVLSAIPIPNR